MAHFSLFFFILDTLLTLGEKDNVESNFYLQAVREVLDGKFENIVTLCTSEIDKSG